MIKGMILIAHGAIAKDYPKEDLLDEQKLREWPRSELNDPYWYGVQRIAQKMRMYLKECPLEVAFNEFCSPSFEQSVERLSQKGVDTIIVLSTMIIPGGSHSEKDIPLSIDHAKQRFPTISFHYHWPYSEERIAQFFSSACTSY